MREIWNGLEKKQQGTIIKTITGCIAITAITFALVGYFMGYNKTLSDAVVEKAARTDAEYTTALAEYSTLKEEINKASNTLSEMANYKANKTKLEKEIEELNKTHSTLNDQIAVKQQELDKLTEDILKVTGKPITLISGDYIIGTDLPQGRYIVSGSSNFIVYSNDNLYINTILGDSFDGDYAATLTDGMIMHCSSKTTFTPVE